LLTGPELLRQGNATSTAFDARPAPAQARTDTDGAYVAPRNPVEEAVAKVWAELLGVERVGVHDNFFDIGGHSLLATQVLSHLRQTFAVDIPLRHLVEEPTVATLALAITQAQGEPKNGAIGKVTLTEDPLLSHLEEMSDEAVDSLLREVLAEEEVG